MLKCATCIPMSALLFAMVYTLCFYIKQACLRSMSCARCLHIILILVLCNIKSLGLPYYEPVVASICAHVPAGTPASSSMYIFMVMQLLLANRSFEI